MTEVMKCPNCGETSRIREKDKYCHRCGCNLKIGVLSDDNSKRIFVPHELKTIEVDVEKKQFKVNGEPFGKYCSYFSISCEASKGFDIRMEIGTEVILETFDRTGTLLEEKEYQCR